MPKHSVKELGWSIERKQFQDTFLHEVGRSRDKNMTGKKVSED